MREGADVGQLDAAPQSVPQTPQDGYWWDGGQKVEAKQESIAARRVDNQLDRLTRKSAGKRSRTKTERKRGKKERKRK